MPRPKIIKTEAHSEPSTSGEQSMTWSTGRIMPPLALIQTQPNQVQSEPYISGVQTTVVRSAGPVMPLPVLVIIEPEMDLRESRSEHDHDTHFEASPVQDDDAENVTPDQATAT